MKWLSRSLNIVFAAVLVVTALVIFLNSFPSLGQRFLMVTTGSMQPNVPVGSLIWVKEAYVPPTPTSDIAVYSVGDVISYKNNSQDKFLTTHRIVGIQEKTDGIYYQTKGDANKNPDDTLVNQKNVTGKIMLATPEIGKILRYTKTPFGYFLIVLIPTLYIVAIESTKIYEELSKRKKVHHSNSLHQLKVGGFLPLFLVGSIFVGTTASAFGDSVVSEDNVFLTAESFDTTVPEECEDIEFDDEPIYGTSSGDYLVGTEGNDLIFGLEGGDYIDGKGGDDCIVGGPHGDYLKGGNGNDVIIGGMGSDALKGGNGDDYLIGGGGSDGLKGGNGNDFLSGGDGSDSLKGNNGEDTLLGGSGSDGLRGGNGNDSLDGGEGNDGLKGGPGIDTCTNGESIASCEL